MNDAIDERLKVDHNAHVKEIALNSIKPNPYQPRNHLIKNVWKIWLSR